jgi:hypothetical protein
MTTTNHLRALLALLLAAAVAALFVLAGGTTLAQTTPKKVLDANCADGPGTNGFVPFNNNVTFAQTFTAVMSGKLISAEALIHRHSSSTGADITMEILAVNNASGAPTSTVLASTTVPGATVPATAQETTITGNFDPASAASVVAGQKYALALRTADTAQNGWSAETGNPCPGGGLYLGSSAFENGDWDAIFAVYLLGPANDNFADAQIIGGATPAVIGTTKGATRETGEPDHWTLEAWFGDHSVWYSWTAPASGSTTIDTCTSDIDSILAVYTGSALDSLTRVAENNNNCPSGWGSKVTFDASEGTTYKIAVGDAGEHLKENTFRLAIVGQPEDTTAPKVSSVTPIKKTGVSRTPKITATFSEKVDKATVEKIDPTTLKTVNVKLTNTATGKQVAATVSCDADPCNKVTITPKRSLEASTKYKATVTRGVEDLAGNALDQDPSKDGNQQKNWAFTTKK